MVTTRTVLFRVSLAFLLAFLSGCVWLRLLEIKNQLADFDEHVRVEIAEQYFILNFREPVLLDEDFIYLSKLNPSRVAKLPQGERWFLDFRIEPPRTREQAAKLVSFTMNFNADRKLSAFGFPPLFLEMAPPMFLEASIRSLGVGKVDQDKRQLKVDPEDLPKLSGRLPALKDIVAVMGPPEEDYLYEGRRILRYRFLAEAKPISPKWEKRREAEAKLFFDPKTESLIRLSGRFAGMRLSIDYRRLTGAGDPDEPPKPAR